MPFHPFAEQGNYTTVHNIVIDKIMPQLTGAEFKTLIAIIRLTVGWHRERDAISYSRFREITGLSSTSTIRRAIDGLEERGLIFIEKTEKWNSPFVYSLNRGFSIPLENEGMEQDSSEEGAKSEGMEESTSIIEVMDEKWVAKSEVLLKKGSKRKKEKNPPNPPIPEKLDTPQFRQAWDDWLGFRKELGVKMTPTTASRQFAKLGKHPPPTAVAMLEQSMCNGWRGLFEVKQSQNGQHAPQKRVYVGEGGRM